MSTLNNKIKYLDELYSNNKHFIQTAVENFLQETYGANINLEQMYLISATSITFAEFLSRVIMEYKINIDKFTKYAKNYRKPSQNDLYIINMLVISLTATSDDPFVRKEIGHIALED